MAHNLATTNGKTAMMYVGEVPLHRLGTKLDHLGLKAEGAIHLTKHRNTFLTIMLRTVSRFGSTIAGHQH